MLLQSQLEELRKHLDEEVKGKQVMSSSLSSAQQDCQLLKEQLDEEQESKQEMQRLVSKLNSEVTHWRSKHEAVSVQHAEEVKGKQVMSSSLSSAQQDCQL
ncbi:myosin heavy chain, cardiac muscle isoform, partial [Austrofundulus limnaeus]|uniref:Myosin heavy chain, cardiac muscle isoform n=1 Tax=Austrofundulus limnaeus TaxID=52670 RepID=A0A2I4AML7_AUSLI